MYGRFADYYDIVYQRYNYEQECDFLTRVFERFHEGKVESILDLGCGTGSHDIILVERGFEVVGVDSSAMMVEQARRKAGNRGLEIEFIVQDMRELQLSKRFDCAICMFGGFGYLLSNKDLRRLFNGLRKVLKPDALFLFEFWNVDGLKSSPYRSWEKRESEGCR